MVGRLFKPFRAFTIKQMESPNAVISHVCYVCHSLYAVKGNVIPITANTLRGRAIKILSGNVNMN